MNTLSQLSLALSHVDKNKIAATASVVPGLGHLYKHNYMLGLGILVLGNAAALALTQWLSYEAFGPAVFIIPTCYWVAVMCNAFYAKDLRGTHLYLQPWKQIDPKKIADERKAAEAKDPMVGEGMNGDGV